MPTRIATVPIIARTSVRRAVMVLISIIQLVLTIRPVVAVPPVTQARPAQLPVVVTATMPAQVVAAAGVRIIMTTVRAETVGQVQIPRPQRITATILRVASITPGPARAAVAATRLLQATAVVDVVAAAISNPLKPTSSRLISGKAAEATVSPSKASRVIAPPAGAIAHQVLRQVAEGVAVRAAHGNFFQVINKKSPPVRTIGGDFRFVYVVITAYLLKHPLND